MDNLNPPQKPGALLNDLESIRELLDDDLDPPLLTEKLDPNDIPLLSDVVPAPDPVFSPQPSPTSNPGTGMASEDELRQTVQRAIGRDNEINRLDSELRAAAQLLLQDVIDDFAPQIEAELKRRLQARLNRLLPPRR
ncbi:DNA polymerase III subunit chi [Pseudomonas daroniae]|uniref:DNA polymerase III subunit chi n=1 Tax=Phytopseudomonas daroniae TaxID=2487519 RepID=A0A4Q9QKV6_9GAMM|nr:MULTISPECIES: DNA polymerase III subunit chi [Pseudomonas]TBU77709.1 DNA polymerase III subunit chi [Pseudomonas daroniae]TBU79105.1 DNA polymerase III subunit chi [Pseudomonas daroniae]TBU86160.1 DNA polymerase III subunit chi [Pseudomonas sp. FRB 228]TBU95323.1 DNA polymerase III subunit chi [Pseudomonas daroniae]